ncbi:MAG TPA: wax ester/triacylglycerol synthase family O-acyltransferase [Burkholderiaceae bacterium]|nr:wax ester/triacylglycerol synthase family O-acyltransferase [Burkholderiaceae bacterium]
MPVAAAERMSRVDTAWLRMDNDVNLMMIVGVWLLEPAITIEALRERIETRLLAFPRFGQKVVHDITGASWVPDRHFDLDAHVVVETLVRNPGQSEREALQARAGELATTPLDPDRPLWQFHLIDRYEGGCALIARIHHCIGDGIALISVMMAITDGGVVPPLRQHAHHDGEGGDAGDVDHDWLADAVIKPLTDVTVQALGMYGDGVARAMETLAHPGSASLDVARHGAQVARDLAALALLPDDSPTLLKGKPVGSKAVAWSDPLPLADVKAVCKAFGCSVNDVLLSCAAGAFGDYLREAGDDPDGKEIRAMVPVNLRPLDQAWKLGNRFGLAPLVLPIGVRHPVERLYAVRARMDEMKGSYQPLLAYGVLAVAGLLTKPVQDALLGLFAKKATAVMTNVPGPAKPLEFCGATLRQSMFWVPASGDIGVGVSILSYAGGVQFSLITDAQLCPDPQRIIDRFAPEFEQLLMVALMMPWGEGP